MKAVLWPYRFTHMRDTWRPQTVWIVDALKKCGVTVKRHPDFGCCGLEELPVYDPETDNPADIGIYNHANQSEIIGNVLKTSANWFMKPTVPDEYHTTLDTLGYGPFSFITYNPPPLERVKQENVNTFFRKEVAHWLEKRSTKWGKQFESKDAECPHEDYHLVIGQCGGDSVVTKMDFGHYFTKLGQICAELARVDTRPVVVKLHPYVDGKDGNTTAMTDYLKGKLEGIHTRVHVYGGRTNIHPFLDRARDVVLANSGAGFEAMMHHKPIIAWGFPEYHWVTYDLRHLCEMGFAISLKWFDREQQDRYLYWYMRHYCFWNQPTAYRRVKELLACVTTSAQH